jgi:hypothetical protein
MLSGWTSEVSRTSRSARVLRNPASRIAESIEKPASRKAADPEAHFIGSQAGAAGNGIAFDGADAIDVETRARRAVDPPQSRAHSTPQRVALTLDDLIENVPDKVTQ